MITGDHEYWRSFVAMALTNAVTHKGGVVFGIDTASVTNLPPAESGQHCACLVPTRGLIYLPKGVLVDRKLDLKNPPAVPAPEKPWPKPPELAKRSMRESAIHSQVIDGGLMRKICVFTEGA